MLFTSSYVYVMLTRTNPFSDFLMLDSAVSIQYCGFGSNDFLPLSSIHKTVGFFGISFTCKCFLKTRWGMNATSTKISVPKRQSFSSGVYTTLHDSGWVGSLGKLLAHDGKSLERWTSSALLAFAIKD